jgi:kynureninase
MPDEFIPMNTAEAWQLSNPPILALAPLLASLEIFNEVGISDLRKKSIIMTDFLYELIQCKLSDKIEIITPGNSIDRGCQLSLRCKTPKGNIVDSLQKEAVIADWREPDVIRIAPVPLYNTFEDCYEFVNRLSLLI